MRVVGPRVVGAILAIVGGSTGLTVEFDRNAEGERPPSNSSKRATEVMADGCLVRELADVDLEGTNVGVRAWRRRRCLGGKTAAPSSMGIPAICPGATAGIILPRSLLRVPPAENGGRSDMSQATRNNSHPLVRFGPYICGGFRPG